MKKTKIGFIVEGDTNRVIVEALARRLLPPSVHFHTVRLGGKAAFSTAYTTVLVYLNKGYDHVVILFDTDTVDEARISEQKLRIEETLRNRHLHNRVTVCPAVPEIEAWLLASYLDNPEVFRDLKARLADAMQIEELTLDDLEQLAETLDIGLIEQRSASFADFVGALQSTVANQLELVA